MNPFVRLYEAPVEALAAAAYVCVLVAVLVLSWWALTRNLVYLDDRYQNGWKYLVLLWYAVRAAATLGLVALDLLLVAAIIHVI